MSGGVWPPDFSPRLVIFDKDGTLIDFNFMWAAWISDLGKRLNSSSGMTFSPWLFRAFGFDATMSRVDPRGPLAVWSMAALRRLVVDVLRGRGLDSGSAEETVAKAWHLPDPVALARPLGDLPRVFRTLASTGVKTAVATSDDRAAAVATLEALGIAPYVDAVVGADDGLRIKPAPDVVNSICNNLEIDPTRTVVVGDAVADLQMGRAAGAGFIVGVLSGVSSREDLMPYADVLIPSVGELV